MRVDLHVLGHNISVIGAYGPSTNEPPEVKDAFYEELSQVMESVRNKDQLFLLGDMNARVGRDDTKQTVVGRYGESELNDNGKRLRDLCKGFELKIQNTFFPHKLVHQITWSKPGCRSSILDYCITKGLSRVKVEDVRVWHSAECGSDHFLLAAKALFAWKQQGRSSRTPREGRVSGMDDRKYKLHLLHEESVRNLFSCRLEGKLEQASGRTVVEKYDLLKRSVHEAAMEALGEVDSGPRMEWKTEEVAQRVLAKKEAYRKWLSSGDAQDLVTYKAILPFLTGAQCW